MRVTTSASTETGSSHCEAPASGDGSTVLVVEDEQALARVVTRILATGGYHVRAAGGGPEALRLYAEYGCDLLLTDVIMPEMSGPRLAALLHEQNPELPVVYMSGYSNGLLDKTHVLDEGITFVEKPFTAYELLQKVAAALGADSGSRR
ncbi:hypothetical protein Aab01nite_54180 [Paractinoplanes abujensis]|uniref:CheY-like chemotaxis protein n=1 Tax=Paractinoplanes abujensis TaxID=882441 RepID=A0A7W7CUG5_9ACTN|nr:response regulator [Actinoplanes abujensis]MBB4693513.1 CheY-like chemotaxis protein [Actinoplanes abujensis]GID21828.1 hypothetical protein Aab01nite_54180 [Actinoplanes abujensis]